MPRSEPRRHAAAVTVDAGELAEGRNVHLMRLADASLSIWGTKDRWALRRTARLVDAGRLKAIRSGPRGDRLVVAGSVDDFKAQVAAEATA